MARDPVCAFVRNMPTPGSRGRENNLAHLAEAIGQRYCKHWSRGRANDAPGDAAALVHRRGDAANERISNGLPGAKDSK